MPISRISCGPSPASSAISRGLGERGRVRVHAHRCGPVPQNVFLTIERHRSGSGIILDGVDKNHRVDTREMCDQIKAGRAKIGDGHARFKTIGGFQEAGDIGPNRVVAKQHTTDPANRNLFLHESFTVS